MTTQDFTNTFLVDQSPEEVFEAVTNVRGWWSEKLEGESAKLNDEFIYRYKDLHWSHQKLVEVIPNKKVVWLVTDSRLNFIEDKKEWNGTTIIFEVSRNMDKTQLRFTHVGLVPELECFEACSGGWTYYINSLHQLITTGSGQPNPEEESKTKKEAI
jgi:uncharacterized protein YndB with AHSA1/START domain